MKPSAFAAASASVLLAVATSGCTLITDDEPFRISVINQQPTEWQGTVIVLDDEGGERFRRALTVTGRSMSLTLDLPPLVGDFTFAVESGGGRWQGRATTAEGSYSWTILIGERGTVCFDFLLAGTGRTDCPTRTTA